MTTATAKQVLSFPAVMWPLAGAIPDIRWVVGDDLCDCTFQRIGEWTNPYMGRTLRVRMCCIWADLYKQYPQFVQEINAAFDDNRNEWTTEPRAWDSEDSDMPVDVWHRQLSAQTGKPLVQVREEYRGRASERPKRVKRGHGWQSRQPTTAELAAAKEARMRASGWLI